MAYGDNKFKRSGIEKEAGIMKGIKNSLEDLGHLVLVNKSTLNEDMKHKIDYKLKFPNVPFKNQKNISIDIKSGNTYTLITTTNQNTIEASKADYLVYEFDEYDIMLFNSGNNDRIYYEESDTYESYYSLIKRRFSEIKENIYSVDL